MEDLMRLIKKTSFHSPTVAFLLFLWRGGVLSLPNKIQVFLTADRVWFQPDSRQDHGGKDSGNNRWGIVTHGRARNILTVTSGTCCSVERAASCCMTRHPALTSEHSVRCKRRGREEKRNGKNYHTASVGMRTTAATAPLSASRAQADFQWWPPTIFVMWQSQIVDTVQPTRAAQQGRHWGRCRRPTLAVQQRY